MPIRDVAAQAASLANDYGATHGPHAPSSFQLALFLGDPNEDGVEVSSTTTLVNDDDGTETVVNNGYAPAVVANDGAHFPAPDPDTGVLTSAVIAFPVSTAEYPDTVTHWLLRETSTGIGWDSGQLPRDDELVVEDAGVTPRISLAIYYGTEG